MKICYAVFRSKTQVMTFVEIMNSYGYNCSLSQTPKEAKVGCGVSAVIPSVAIQIAKKVILNRSLNSFYAFILVEKNGRRTSTYKIWT